MSKRITFISAMCLLAMMLTACGSGDGNTTPIGESNLTTDPNAGETQPETGGTDGSSQASGETDPGEADPLATRQGEVIVDTTEQPVEPTSTGDPNTSNTNTNNGTNNETNPGETNNNENTEPTPPVVTRFGPYTPYTGNGLSVVDMGDADLKQYSVTDKPITASALVRSISLVANNTNVSDVQPTYVVYVADGKLWKTDLRAGSDLAMSQVSSASMSNACFNKQSNTRLEVSYSLDTAPDFASVAWQTSGVDGKCETTNDNQRWRVLLVANETTPPLDVTNLPAYGTTAVGFLNPQDLSAGPTEILAVDGKNLKRYDSNYGNPVTVASANSSVEILNWKTNYAVLPTGKFVRVDDTIRWYAIGANTLTDAQFMLSSTDDLRQGICDRTDCFFTIFNRTSRDVSIFRVALGGASDAALVAENVVWGGQASTGQLYNFTLSALTNNYVVYSSTIFNANAKSNVFRVAKTGGMPVAFGAENIDDESVSQISETRLMFSSLNTEKQLTINVMNEDGTSLFTANDAVVAGGNYGFVPASVGVTLGYNAIVLVTNFSAAMAGTEGAKIQAYNPLTNTLSASLGQLPLNTLGDLESVNNTQFVFAARTLDKSATPPLNQSDIYFVDLMAANSLKRLTQTNTISEEVVNYPIANSPF